LDAAVDLLVGKDEAISIRQEVGRVPETVWTLEVKGIYTAWTSVSSVNNFHLKSFMGKVHVPLGWRRRDVKRQYW
jgi:hypothetical protein